jgi:hypothetical protein
MALARLRARSFKCDTAEWAAAQRKADERGENFSEQLRRFVRDYPKPRRGERTPGPDQTERPA